MIYVAEVNKILKSIGKSLQDYPTLPQPPSHFINSSSDNLVLDERSYDRNVMNAEYEGLLASCNEQQISIYTAVMESIKNNEGKTFFVHGSGGCGKTYLWRTLISRL